MPSGGHSLIAYTMAFDPSIAKSHLNKLISNLEVIVANKVHLNQEEKEWFNYLCSIHTRPRDFNRVNEVVTKWKERSKSLHGNNLDLDSAIGTFTGKLQQLLKDEESFEYYKAECRTNPRLAKLLLKPRSAPRQSEPKPVPPNQSFATAEPQADEFDEATAARMLNQLIDVIPTVANLFDSLGMEDKRAVGFLLRSHLQPFNGLGMNAVEQLIVHYPQEHPVGTFAKKMKYFHRSLANYEYYCRQCRINSRLAALLPEEKPRSGGNTPSTNPKPRTTPTHTTTVQQTSTSGKPKKKMGCWTWIAIIAAVIMLINVAGKIFKPKAEIHRYTPSVSHQETSSQPTQQRGTSSSSSRKQGTTTKTQQNEPSETPSDEASNQSKPATNIELEQTLDELAKFFTPGTDGRLPLEVCAEYQALDDITHAGNLLRKAEKIAPGDSRVQSYRRKFNSIMNKYGLT